MAEPPNSEVPRPGTIGVYAAPPWWRTRRFWRIALPVVVAIASVAIWFAILA